MASELTKAQYSGMDFQTYLDDLRARVQVQYASSYNDFAVSSLGMMLLDHTAYGLDTLSFYLDRRTTDSYLETARTRKSVARLTRQLGYKMGPAVASSVDLNVTIASPGIDVTIPQGFQFKGPDSLIFECAQPVTWENSDSVRTKVVSCYEGQTQVESFVSDGSANQVFKLKKVPDAHFIVLGTVTVSVNGSYWEESEFLSFDKTDQFELGYNDDPPTLRFGDGNGAGNIPATAATIAVTYVASRGRSGIVTKNTIKEPKNKLVVGFQTIEMQIDNPLGSSGGDDPETLQHAKTFAPLVYKSRYVAVTRNDYEALSKSFADPLFGRVAVAQALSSRSADSDVELTTQANVIYSAIDVPLFTAGAAVQISGTAAVEITTGIATGNGTAFQTEVVLNGWLTFGADTVLRQVVSITDDRHLLVVPAPDISIPEGPIYRYGASIVQARSLLKSINGTVTLLDDDASAIAVVVSDQCGADGDAKDITDAIRIERNRALQIEASDTVNITTALASMESDSTNGFSTFATTPTTVGSGINGTLSYTAKAPGVSIQHVLGAALAVSVPTPSQILVTMEPAGSSALAIAQAVNSNTDANQLVLASYSGTGVSLVPATAYTSVLLYLPTTTLAAHRSWMGAVAASNSTIQTTATSIRDGLDTQAAALSDLQLAVAAIGTTPTEGLLDGMTAKHDSIRSILGDTAIVANYSSVSTTSTLVTNLDAIQNSVVTNQVTIGGAVDAIVLHVDSILSADCKANLITVPILAKDKAGFLTSPSNGLISALQRYLDARKEVTQTVQVTNGGTVLVAANILVRLGVLPNYTVSIIRTAVSTAIDGLLRAREFGQDLYVSDLVDAITPLRGVAFVNITIQGPSDYLDYSGNLRVGPENVITKGSVVFNPDPPEVKSV